PSVQDRSSMTTRCCVPPTSYAREQPVRRRSPSHELVRLGTGSTTIAVVSDLVGTPRLRPIERNAILTQRRVSPQKGFHSRTMSGASQQRTCTLVRQDHQPIQGGRHASVAFRIEPGP